MARLRKSQKFFSTYQSGPQPWPAPSAANYFSVEPCDLFGNAAPLEVEIGAGKGDFILQRARQTPQRNFLAVELAGSVFQWLSIRIARSGLNNLKAIRADARPVVNLMLPAASVRAFHIYFPDPWPKSRHSRHRLFTPALIAGLARCLEPGGQVFAATDVDWYFEYIGALFAQSGFQATGEPAEGAQRSGFGRRFASEGKPIHGGCFRLGRPLTGVNHDSPLAAADA